MTPHPDDVATRSDIVRWAFLPEAIEAFMRTLVEVRELPEHVYA